MVKKRRTSPSVAKPSALWIFGKRYSVKYAKLKGDYGSCHPNRCQLNVDTQCHEDQQRDTILHETTHAIDHELKIGLREIQVHRLATGLTQVLRDNPAFVTWLCKR